LKREKRSGAEFCIKENEKQTSWDLGVSEEFGKYIGK